MYRNGSGSTEAARRLFAQYTSVSLSAPTFVATALAVFDDIRFDDMAGAWRWASVCAALLLLAAQQSAWLRRSEVWPQRTPEGRPLPRWVTWVPGWFVSLPALVSGVAVAAVLVAVEVGRGRPLLLWMLPGAAAVGVLVLAGARWDRERPRWPSALVILIGGEVVLLGLAGGVGALRFSSATGQAVDPWSVWGLTLLVAVAAVAFVVGVQVGQVWWDRVVVELTRARAALVEQALVQERLRFAGELHDLQGHELQVIQTQAELGQALLAARGAAAVSEVSSLLAGMSTAARGALAQTRQIALGYRRVAFADEVANARSVLEAAGVAVEVVGSTDRVCGSGAELAGLVVRESTTNLLRHSLAQAVAIEVREGPSGFVLSVTDPGPSRPRTGRSLSPGSGLSELGARARTQGCRVVSGPLGEGWRVTLVQGKDA